jgi:quercetin 2,3-dioxygenase
VSGPLTADDVDSEARSGEPAPAELEIRDSREAQVGALRVRRALPQRERRTVGAWCFLDHAGPVQVMTPDDIGIGPHPHIGLQTVTWLIAGELLHRDSLGSEQAIRPGELNLMTAGHGIVHAEDGTGHRPGEFHAVQLWVAQPSATREGRPAFEHHSDLPRGEFGGAVATVLVGGLGSLESPARRDTDHVGVDLDLRGDAIIPLRSGYEHALVMIAGSVTVDGRPLEPGHLAYLGLGRDELSLSPSGSARALLVGGVPFPERVSMWWNYVARTKEEISAAHREWTQRTDRFRLPPSPSRPVDVPPPPWEPL